MKRIWITLGATLLLSLGAQAQDLRPKVDEKGRVGFVDASGNEVVSCKYESAAAFIDGVSIVSKSDKYGLVNEQGIEVLKPKYELLVPWGKDLFLAKKGKNYGLIAKDGSVALPLSYLHISKPNCYGKAWISKGGKVVSSNGTQFIQGGKYGIVNSDGIVAVEPKYKGLYEFTSASNIRAMHDNAYPIYKLHVIGDTLVTNGEYYAVSKDEKSAQKAGIVSSTGELLMPIGKATWVMPPVSDMVRCYNATKSKTTCMYYNMATKKMLTVSKLKGGLDDLKEWTHSDFHGDVAAVNTTEGWNFIDKAGNTLRSGYAYVLYSSNAKAWAGVKAGESECDAFDEQNQPLFAEGVKIESIEFSDITSHTDIFGVKMNGKWGAIDRQGKEVIPFAYERVKSPMFDYVPVKTANGWGMRTLSDQEVMPCQFADLLPLSEEHPRIVWGKNTDNLWYAYDMTQKQLRPNGYEMVTNYQDGYAWVKPKGYFVPDDAVTRGMVKLVTKQNVSDEVFASQQPYFGSLLGLDGEVYAEGPYYINLLPNVIHLVHANGDKKLTKTQNKKLGLYMTQLYRSYPMETKINVDNWDF